MNYKEKALHLLQSEKESMLAEWKLQLNVPKDYAAEKIYTYADALFSAIIEAIGKGIPAVEEQLQAFACIAAAERQKSDNSIADFIRNVSCGRNIFYSRLVRINDFSPESYESLQTINECFDLYIIKGVAHYTELKSKVIENQYYFLNRAHKDRLTLLGQMTSGFVHEFRNPLTSIMGFIQLLQADHPNLKYLDIISKELSQLNLRITQFLTMSKRESIDTDADLFSAGDLLTEAVDFLYPSILGSYASISCEKEDNLLIEGMKEEFRQVLLNIMLNTLEAVSGTSEPAIEIFAYRTENGTVTISIANNGPKIDSKSLNEIFQPFMTTKAHGTGLGLFVCKEIIERHNGSLTCVSNDEKTEFIIEVPSSQS